MSATLKVLQKSMSSHLTDLTSLFKDFTEHYSYNVSLVIHQSNSVWLTLYRKLHRYPSLVNYDTEHIPNNNIKLSHVAEWYAIMDVLYRQLNITTDDDKACAALEGMRALVLGLIS